MNTRTMQSAVSGAETTVAGDAASAAGSAPPVRVLILTGANNHDWKATTPVLRELFDRCPRFQVVDVIDDPATLDSGKLATCDVVVSNWSAYPEMTRRWGTTAEKAFVDFISSGKGFVVFHAASATCQDWPEFQQLVALTWKLDHTAHGSFHTFKVAITDRDHPITQGMQDFWTTDELWHNMANLSDRPVRALAQVWSEPDFNGTNKFEPVLIPTVLGRGRGLNLVLGHDAHAMLNVGWRTIMLRGTEWAATGPELAFEPRLALAGGRDGLDAFRTLIRGAPAHLQPGGWLLLEHGHTQGPDIRALLRQAGFTEITTTPDLAGRPRVSEGRRGAGG